MTLSDVPLEFQPIAPSHHFQFGADCILDVNHGARLEYKCRQHRAEFVNHSRIVTLHQHVPAPFTHAYNKHFDLEIGRGRPLTEDIKDTLLRILVLDRRTLWAFEPTDASYESNCSMRTRSTVFSVLAAQVAVRVLWSNLSRQGGDY